MAKQKKIPAKQAMYEQILTQQLYGNREEAFNSFKADYDNWNKRQQDIASFKADYDNWNKAQAPVEQPKASKPQKVKVEEAKPLKVEKPKEQPKEQPFVAPRADYKSNEKKTYITHNDVIPSLTKVNVDKQKMGRDNYNQMKKLGEGGSVDLFKRPKVSTSELKKAGWNDAGEGTATVFSSTYTNSNGDKAGNFTPIVTDKNGKYVRTLSERELTEYAEAVMDGRINDDLGLQIGAQTSGANAIDDAVRNAEKVHDLQEELYVYDPVEQAALKWGVSKEEALERLYPSKSKLEAPGKVDEEMTKKVQEAIAEEDRKKAQKKHGVWDAFTGRMAKASKDIVNAPVAIAGRIAGKDWSLYSDAQKQELKELQEQHPIASTAGDLAGMAFAAYTLGGGSKGVTPSGANAGEVARALRDEAILNGATKAQAAKYAAMGAIPTLTSNVAQAMPIDLATDIIPTLANDIAEGEKSDAEIVRDTLVNTGINAGFDAIGDIASIVKASRNMGNPVSADDAFRANINEGYEKIKRLNDIEAEKAVGDYKQYGNLTEINTKKLLNANNELDEIIKNNPNIDIIGSDIKKTPEIITAEKNAINDQVTSFLNGTMKPSEFLNLGHASGILQRYGVTDDDLYMLQRDIKKVLGRAGDNVRNSHNIGSGAFEAIPEKLEEPIAIIRSSSKNADDSVVVLTDLVDQEGHSVIAAIRINGDGNVKIDNQLTSYYGKNDIQKYLSSQAEKGNILYINEIKASADSAGHGLQSSAPVNPEASISNTAAVDSSKSLSNYDIADGIENVNKNSINNEEINVIKDMNVGSDLRKQYGIEGFEEAESFALPDDVFERVDDYAAELAKPLNDVQNSGIMETVTDEKALKEWAAVNKAYEDYVMKSIESAFSSVTVSIIPEF